MVGLEIKKEGDTIMKLIKSDEVSCSLADFIKLHGLRPFMVIYFEDHEPMIVGDCTPYIRPTNNDGGIGWDFREDYCLLKVTKYEQYTLDSRCSRELRDFRKVPWAGERAKQ